MSEKEKERDKAGLHKKISSIFSGVLIPQQNSSRMSSDISTPEDKESAEPQQQAPEAQESESQNAQILPEAISAQESRPEPVEQTENKPVSPPKFMTAQESKVTPIEESEIDSHKDSEDEPIQENNVEPVQESSDEQADTPEIVAAQESKVILIQKSETESSHDADAELIQENNVEPVQEPKAEQADAPRFVTAQESKVTPIEESQIESSKDSETELTQDSNVEPVQESRAKQANTPKFMTAQESKVVPIEESDVNLTQESEIEPACQSKLNKDKKPKVIPVKESKKADIPDISKKRSVVKVGGESSWRQITSKLFEAKQGVSTTKQKAMVIMMPILFIILIVFVIKGGVLGTSAHTAQTGEENNIGVTSVSLNDQIDWEIPEPYPATLRDPTQIGPVGVGTNQAESTEIVQLIVKGILYSEDNPSAIISNRIVYEGDQIQGASITKINKDSVEFEMNGKKWSQGIQR